ncbi:MAG: lipopolysaccharide kinase InaA family protein, partial [Gammaproteobacteria bacterium]
LQSDMHAGNFILQSDYLYSLDGDAIKQITTRRTGVGPKVGLKNLALLIAQLSFVHEINKMAVYNVYCKHRCLVPAKRLFAYFVKQIDKKTKKIRHKVLQKTLRECSSFMAQSGLTLRSICERDQSKTMLPALLPLLDRKLKDQSLADGVYKTTAYETVKLPIKDSTVMVKRYAVRNLYEGFLHGLGFSKARKEWLNAHSLALIRVPIVNALAYCEKGIFPWFGKTFLVTEFVEGISLKEFVLLNEHDNEALTNVFESLAFTFEKLARSLITYGDMDANRFLVTKQGVLLTDFDKIKQHRSAKSFNHQSRQQFNAFLQNWQSNPQVANMAISAFKKSGLIKSFLE